MQASCTNHFQHTLTQCTKSCTCEERTEQCFSLTDLSWHCTIIELVLHRSFDILCNDMHAGGHLLLLVDC